MEAEIALKPAEVDAAAAMAPREKFLRMDGKQSSEKWKYGEHSKRNDNGGKKGFLSGHCKQYGLIFIVQKQEKSSKILTVWTVDRGAPSGHIIFFLFQYFWYYFFYNEYTI